MLLKVKVPFTLPTAFGAKVTVNEVLLPAGIVVGRERPPIVKAELFVLAPVTATLAPLAVRVPVTEVLLPTTALPKLSVALEIDNAPVCCWPPEPPALTP